MSTFTIQVADDQVAPYLQRLTRHLEDLTPLMTDLARRLANLTEDAFQDERSPWGVPWAPLDAAYVRRQRHGDAHPILQRSGGLAASVTHGGDRTSAWVGVSKLYAAIHQFGGTAGMAPGPAAVPARPYLPLAADGSLAPAAQALVVQGVERYLQG